MKAYAYKHEEQYFVNDGTGKVLGPFPSKDAAKSEWPRIKSNRDRRERHRVLTDMGLSRVRGALGGVYYE